MGLPRLGVPDLGVGVGLRVPHYKHIFEHWPKVDWFEVISENFMVDGGRPIMNLERALSHYRVVPHGVALSLGSTAPLDWDHLRKLKKLVQRVKPPWFSDHLCWTGIEAANLHDLMPLPYTEEALKHVVERAKCVQDFLELRFAVENVSSYMTFDASQMTEWEFLSRVADEADVGLLFDVNNVYVAAENHHFDANEYVDSVPHERIVQIHLAGHTRFDKYILDTHSDHVCDPVWDLYRRTIAHTGPVSTLVEWDDDIPAFEVLLAEAAKAIAARNALLSSSATHPERTPSLSVAATRELSHRGDSG